MDAFNQQNQSADISKLSDYEKRELQQSLNNELQKAKIQESVHNLTDICWKKCMTKGISSGKLDRNEESCTQNCVDRFLDANDAVLKHLNAMRGGM